MAIVMTLKNPLQTAWDSQYVRLNVPGLKPDAPCALRIDGQPWEFQYTGTQTDGAAQILVRLGFEKNQTRTLEFAPAPRCTTDRTPLPIALDRSTAIGVPGRELRLTPPAVRNGAVAGPLAGFATFPLESRILCGASLQSCSLTRTNDGPLFIEYELHYQFADHRDYRMVLRCYRDEPIIEVAETNALGMDSRLELTLNPQGLFDRFLGRESFEGENQPSVEPLGQDRPKDILCRLQMPVLTEYFIPNNVGWFALFDNRNESRGMLGVLGLYGARWTRPVENMMHIYDRAGRVELHASLNGGTRHWLLYAGPLQTRHTPDQRLVFHRLHAQFNALRLDEHLDLSAGDVHDASCWDKPGFFGPDYRVQARRNVEALPPLRRLLEQVPADTTVTAGGVPRPSVPLRTLLDGTPQLQQIMLDDMVQRFEKWVRDFQGYRLGHHDYAKNVIGFTRRLRGLMIHYELLRKDAFLSDEQVRILNSYFAFAARRILDEGRWPHSRTWMHPDHPDSTRDFYTYGGEHKPDKLVWTNCLPNFQSDPICALLHLSALLPDHPDAAFWRRFAIDDINRQLDAYCGPTGAWEESINYALYTFSYMVITFRTLKNRCGIDYFQDQRMRRFAGWLTRFLGPVDKRWDKYTYPGVGNAVCPTGGGEYLLCYAGELEESDPLRQDLIAAYQRLEPNHLPLEHYPVVMATMAPIPDRTYPLRPLQSELMAEIGVAMRHGHPSPTESYLVQKIGFTKDHYESDETAFNWYAKGTPLTMDYGTYTGDIGGQAAHNLIEIPDLDNLRRGYLATSLFTPVVDYTRCEMPVTLKLSHGHVRSFAEVDGPPQKPLFFYIGDQNPVGPKTWKTRMLLFVKPDYLLILDRVFGAVPHRYNLHVTADDIRRDGATIHARGRFDLDLHCFVQHPTAFDLDTGELIPAPDRFGQGAANPHRQKFFRLYNHQDGLYRTVLFAKERDRQVTIESFGACGAKITTPQYTDYAFINDQLVTEQVDGVSFTGRVGWIRRHSDGRILAAMPDGDVIAAFNTRIEGMGPWSYNMEGKDELIIPGTPRPVRKSNVIM